MYSLADTRWTSARQQRFHRQPPSFDPQPPVRRRSAQTVQQRSSAECLDPPLDRPSSPDVYFSDNPPHGSSDARNGDPPADHRRLGGFVLPKGLRLGHPADIGPGGKRDHRRLRHDSKRWAEIIRQAWPLWWGTVEQHSGRPPALENLIELTFELSDLLKRNRMVQGATSQPRSPLRRGNSRRT